MQFEDLALIVLLHKSCRGFGFYEILTTTAGGERGNDEQGQ
jgi:hypothetical protein